MPLQIIKRDITTLNCDIIVNPTDEFYSGSGGTDYAIHKAAGKELDTACENLPSIGVGEVQYTSAFHLENKYIIHTVGPIWNGGNENEEMSLRSCYMNSLVLAVKLKAESIAFPLIASGTFGFPKDKVLRIAVDTISDFFGVTDYEIDVTICVIDKNAFELSKETELKKYIAETEEPQFFCNSSIGSAPQASSRKTRSPFRKNKKSDEPVCYECSMPVDAFVPKPLDGFAVTLLKLIDEKGMTDVECYKKANVSKQTFSKIMNNKNYNPNKKTIICFAISLQLNLEETENLLKTVGYSLSHSNMFDLIIEFYISNGIYDIYEINAALYKYDQITLGC